MNTSFVKERLNTLNLNTGETKIIGVRPTKNASEVQLVFAEKIDRPSNRSALADFNASDERFENKNVQLVWMKAMLADINSLLPGAYPASKRAIEEQEYVTLDVSNPTLGGKRLRVEIRETYKPSKWVKETIEYEAKQDGEGNYLHHNHLVIFMHSDIVKGEPQHQFIQHTGFTKDLYELKIASNEYQPDQIEDAIFERKTGANQPELA